MSGFKERVLDTYFAYRRRYVDHILLEAPHRASLAVLSELARLSFAIAGNALCALVFWALTAGAAARPGGGTFWPFLFAAIALAPTAFGLMSVRGFATALGDRRRVRERGAFPAKVEPS